MAGREGGRERDGLGSGGRDEEPLSESRDLALRWNSHLLKPFYKRPSAAICPQITRQNLHPLSSPPTSPPRRHLPQLHPQPISSGQPGTGQRMKGGWKRRRRQISCLLISGVLGGHICKHGGRRERRSRDGAAVVTFATSQK